MTQSIRIAFLNQGRLRVELVLQLYEMLKDTRYKLMLECPTDQPVANNRNGIVRRFLDAGEDWLYMNDEDIIPWRNPLDFVERDLDVVGFPCPIYKTEPKDGQPLRWNVQYTIRGETIREDVVGGLRKVAGIGTGAILIARRVLEHPAMRGPFMDQYNEDGLRTNSEDLSFCDRARAAGFTIYAALCAPCSHNKSVDLLYLMNIYKKDTAQPPVAGRILQER